MESYHRFETSERSHNQRDMAHSKIGSVDTGLRVSSHFASLDFCFAYWEITLDKEAYGTCSIIAVKGSFVSPRVLHYLKKSHRLLPASYSSAVHKSRGTHEVMSVQFHIICQNWTIVTKRSKRIFLRNNPNLVLYRVQRNAFSTPRS